MRNYSIDILKLVLALFIAIGHGGIEIISSDIIVHCFFILSGFFLVKSFDSGKYNQNSINYIKNRFLKIFPYYLSSLLIFLFVLFIQNNFKLQYIFSQLKNIVPEIFLMQNTGFFVKGGINYPLWQMSVLFITSFILFGVLSFNRNFCLTVICPIIALSGFAYWENLYLSHEIDRWGVLFGFFYVPLIRGFASMCLGMFSYDIITKVVVFIKKYKLSWLFSSVLFILSVIYFSINNDCSLAFWGFVGIIISCMVPDNLINIIFNKKFFSFGEKISLAIYFNHAIVLQLIGRNILSESNNKIIAILLYSASLLVISYIYIYIYN